MVLLNSIRQEMLRTVDELEMESIDSRSLILAQAKLAKYFALADYTLQLFATNEPMLEPMPVPAPVASTTTRKETYPTTEPTEIKEEQAHFIQQTSLPIHQVAPQIETIVCNPVNTGTPSANVTLDADGLVDGFRLTATFAPEKETPMEKKPSYKIVEHKKESATEPNRAAAFLAANPTALLGAEEPVKLEATPAPAGTAVQTIEKPVTNAEKPAPMNTYPMKRMLSGGTLNNETIFVPEKVIRRHGLKNGDIVRAVFIKNHNGRAMYNYEPVEIRNEPEAKNRNSFEFGVVAYDDVLKQYYVEENAQRDVELKVNGVPARMMITSHDQQTFHLNEGDIIDIAWYTDRFTEARVIWKHNIAEVLKSKTEAKRIKEHAAKERRVEPEEVKEEEIEQNLAGKMLVLIGCEPYHAEMKQVVAERGGRLTTLSGDESKIKLNTNIRKSDACIVALQHVSHDASNYSVTWAKRHKVPFETFNGYGKGQFLMAVYKALGILGK